MAPGEKLIAADEPEEHQDVVLKSFVCLEGEVVVQDEAVLVRRLEGEEDVSFGSLVCSGGEVQVSSLLMTELAAGTLNTPVCTAAASVSGQPLGRSYCVRASPREDPENTVNRSDQDQEDLSEGRRGVSSGEGEITFKGLCCSGGEMEIGDVSGMSVFMENLTEEQSVCCLYDVSADDARSSAADHQQLKNAPQVLGDGPLQEQLRQMAEMLMVASGKVFARAPAAVEMRSACVWSSPVQQTERSTNTSAALEVSDACTSTDSLLWK